PPGWVSIRAGLCDRREGKAGACAPVAGGDGWLVVAADLGGADVEAVGVVLALQAAAAIAVDIVAAIGRTAGDRGAGNRAADDGRANAPAMAGLGRAGRNGQARGQCHNSQRAGDLGLEIHDGLPPNWRGPEWPSWCLVGIGEQRFIAPGAIGAR